MSSIVSSITGNAGGAGGTGFAGPVGANILNPATTDQANQLYGQNQDALTQQQNFLTALQGQNGIGNQNQVFNQLSGVANGTGPNPAQAQLNQATGANTANQAALMAGQRGSGANAGLIARQAAQQGGANQQAAAGQAATMQANQSLNALNSMGNIAGQQVSNQAAATGANTGAVQGEQGQILGAIQGQNNANVSSQNNINSANAQLANTRLGSQTGLLGGALNAAGPIVSGLGGLLSAGGSAASGLMAGGAADAVGSGAADAAPALALAAKGGKIQRYAFGTADAQPAQPQVGAQSSFGKFINSVGKAVTSQGEQSPDPIKQDPLYQGMTNLGKYISSKTPTSTSDAPVSTGMSAVDSSGSNYAKGGTVPALLSPGEKYLSPKDLSKVKAGADPMAVGKTVPGSPKVDGAKNSYANDTYKTELEEGGVVIPRSVTKQPASVRDKKAEAFVSQYLAQGGRVKGMVMFSSKRAK